MMSPSPPSVLHRDLSTDSDIGLRAIPMLSPPRAHLSSEPAGSLPPLSLLLSQPRRPDAAVDVLALNQSPPSIIKSSSLSPLSKHQRTARGSRARGPFCSESSFCRGGYGCNPALSSATILVCGVLAATLIPSWIGFRVLKDVSGPEGLPPFWYLTLVGAFASLATGVVFGCVVGIRAARHSHELEMSSGSGLTFLVEDWVGRAAVAACVVLGMFALPIGMAIFGRASAYSAVDGMMMEVVGLGVLSVLAVCGGAGYVLWYAGHGEWCRRKLLVGYTY